MDPTIPPTMRYYWHYVIQRLGNLRNWMSILTGRSGLLRQVLTHLVQKVRPSYDSEGLTLQNLRFNSYLARCYQDASARGVKMLSILTSVSVRHTYRQQMLDAFPEASTPGALRLEFFPESDHLFSSEKQRARLYRVIAEWLGSH
jgi:hypothetical protein